MPPDQNLFEAIALLNTAYKKNLTKFKTFDDLSDTVQDPMSIFVHTVFSGINNRDEWFTLEKMRRIDKALANQIGLFHEKILSSVPGWHKPTGGFDLANHNKKIIVEIKNKHNTMNASSTADTYEKCYRYYQSNRAWTVYVAQIIPKNGRVDKPWIVSGRTPNDSIRVVDGATLYDMVTQEKNALREVYIKIIALLKKLDLKINESQINMIFDVYDKCYSSNVQSGNA